MPSPLRSRHLRSHLLRSRRLRSCLLRSRCLRSRLLRSRTDVFTVFSSSVPNVEYSSPARRRFGIRISMYAFAAAIPTGGLHDAAIYSAGDDIALSPPPISMSPSIAMPPNVVNAHFLQLSHLLQSTVSFNNGTSTVGAQSKYTQQSNWEIYWVGMELGIYRDRGAGETINRMILWYGIVGI